MIPELPDYVTVTLDGYSETVVPNILRSDFEDGYVRQESRVSVTRIEKKVMMVVCTLADLQAFRCWFQQELRNGSRWFTYKDPIEGATVRGRFRDGALSYRPRQKVLAGTKFEIDAIIEVWADCVQT